MKYISRLPKLFEIVTFNLQQIEKLQDSVEDLENHNETSKYINQVGSGEYKQNIKKVNEDVKQLIDDIAEIKESLKGKNENIESVEKLLLDTDQIAELFRQGNYNDLIYNIEKLRNAAIAINRSEGILEKALKTKERTLIEELACASPFEAREILDVYFTILKDIFQSVVKHEDMKRMIEDYKVNRLGQSRYLLENVDSFYNESENEENNLYQPMTEEVYNTDDEENSAADETSDEEWNVDLEPENDDNNDTEEIVDGE